MTTETKAYRITLKQKKQILELAKQGFSGTQIFEDMHPANPTLSYSMIVYHIRKAKNDKAQKKAAKQAGLLPKRKYTKRTVAEVTPATAPKVTNNLVKEIVNEIRAELKASILKELLG